MFLAERTLAELILLQTVTTIEEEDQVIALTEEVARLQDLHPVMLPGLRDRR